MKLTDESIMPFGVWKGKKMGDVPDDYLLWIYENKRAHGDVKEYIEDNLDAIKLNLKRKQNEQSKRTV